MACNCGKRRMAQITSANITDSNSPTHAEAAARLVAEAAAIEVSEPAPARTNRIRRRQ